MKWIVPVLLAIAAPATARTADAAFSEGRFPEAATLGQKEGTTASLVLACRAQAIGAAYEVRDAARAGALLDQAVDSCDRALKTAPGNPVATLHRGLAIGYQAKLARSPGLAKDARRAFEAALARMPGDATALAALGGWHGESVATLGRFIAGTALGAREKDSRAWFDKALAAPDADPVVPVFYASTLLALSADNATAAKALLQRATRTRARDGFEALVQKNGRAILTPLEAGRIEEARETARRLSPLGQVG